MAYPAAYRPAAKAYGGTTAFKVPSSPRPPAVRPFVPRTIPMGITPNPANIGGAARGAGMVLGRGLTRFVPYVGTALLAYELWDWFQTKQGELQYPGFSMICSTPGPCAGFENVDVFNATWDTCPLSTCADAHWQYIGTPGVVNPNADKFGVWSWQDATGTGVIIGKQLEAWRRDAGYTEDWVESKPVYAPVPFPIPSLPQPWQDPLRPPLVPMPLPEPPPYREATPDPAEPEAQPSEARQRDPRERPWVRVTPGVVSPGHGRPWTRDRSDPKGREPLRPVVPLPWPPQDNPEDDKPEQFTPGDLFQDPGWWDWWPRHYTPGGVVIPEPVVLVPGSVMSDPSTPRIVVETTVITDNGVKHEPPNEQRAPPGERTKEKKLKLKTVAPGALALINFATEGLDFVDVLWNAIPKHLRGKRSPGDYLGKLEDIYANFESIDVAKVVENFVNNQLEDFLYAQGSRQVGRRSGEIGVTTGLDRATRIGGEAYKDAGGDAPELPELHYDADTGEWSIIKGKDTILDTGIVTDTTTFGNAADDLPDLFLPG